MKQNLIYASLAVAGSMILASITDIALGFPFNQMVVPDIFFVIAGAAIIWMSLDCLKSQRKKK
ncbi:MAG: hypothetical protein MK102_12100 [Fuerstiella sp.]|nr:hypothetical protein [Fuerstiella sp.]